LFKSIDTQDISVQAGWEEWDGTSWIAATRIPTVGDVAYANGFDKTIDQDWTVDEIRNDVFQGTTGSGRFELTSAGITLDTTRYSNGVPILYVSFGSGTSTVLGEGFTLAGGQNTYNTLIEGQLDGILNLEYSGIGNGTNRWGTSVQGVGSGFEIQVSNINGGFSTYAYGIIVTGNDYKIVNNGICQGGTGTAASAFVNQGNGNTFVNNGIVKGIEIVSYVNCVGVYDYNGMNFINNGIIQASLFSFAFIARGASGNNTAPSFYGVGQFVAGGILIDTDNFNAVAHSIWKLPELADGDLTWQMKTPINGDRHLYTAGLLTGYPLEADVEDGVVYGPSDEFEGTLSPVVVDTAQLATDLLNDIQTSSHVVAQRLRAAATDDSVGDIVASTLGA